MADKKTDLKSENENLQCDVTFWKEKAFEYKANYEIAEKEAVLLNDSVGRLQEQVKERDNAYASMIHRTKELETMRMYGSTGMEAHLMLVLQALADILTEDDSIRKADREGWKADIAAKAEEIERLQAEAAVMWHIINKTQQWALAEEKFGPLFAELIESVLFVDISSTGQAVTDRLQQAEAAVSVARELRHAEKSREYGIRKQLRARLDKMLADLAIWPESCEVCNCLDGDTVVCGPECPHFEDQPGVPI